MLQIEKESYGILKKQGRGRYQFSDFFDIKILLVREKRSRRKFITKLNKINQKIQIMLTC